jgi:hypothetical protein
MRRQLFSTAKRELSLASLHLSVHHLSAADRLLHERRNTILECDTDYTHFTECLSKISQIRPEHKDDDDDVDDDDERRQENNTRLGFSPDVLKRKAKITLVTAYVSASQTNHFHVTSPPPG